MTNRNGSTNQTYINLTRTRLLDHVVSYANGRIGAVGVVSANCVEAERPLSFGEIGEQWDMSGWMVMVDWVRMDTALVPRAHMDTIGPLLPPKYSPIRKNGDGNQGRYLAELGADMGQVLLGLSTEVSSALSSGLIGASSTIKDNVEHERLAGDEALSPTVREQLVRARIGQGTFRANLEMIEKGCRITGVSDRRFLTASHIKPWSESSNKEKLNGNNGLLLSPHVDRLFDRGWISFSSRGELIVANSDVEGVMECWSLVSRADVGPFDASQQVFLEYYREHVYQGTIKA